MVRRYTWTSRENQYKEIGESKELVTLNQYKENLAFEAKEIEKRLERRAGTPNDIKRLEEINQRFENIAKVEKPDSIAKKAKAEATQ